jgi:hypothetical protein
MVRMARVERAASWFVAKCSVQMSYIRMESNGRDERTRTSDVVYVFPKHVASPLADIPITLIFIGVKLFFSSHRNT